MRINANIIDDEDAFSGAMANEKKKTHGQLPVIREDISSNSRETMFQHCRKIHEMTMKFKNLHVSDSDSNIDPFPNRDHFIHKGMTSSSNRMEKSESNSSTLSNMDTASSTVGDIPKTLNNIDSAPSWLLQYLTQMKYDIKKEIIEELLLLPPMEPQCSHSASDEKKENPQEVVHYGIFCDNCDQLIHGVRYKCGNCSDYDLCQECESLPDIHNKNHIFLKVRYPMALKFYQNQKLQHIIPSMCSGMHPMNLKKYHSAKYEVQFMCDVTVPDGTELIPSQRFVKKWRVFNSGTKAWNHKTKLCHIQGSLGLIPDFEVVDVPHLKPGEQGIVSVNFTAPSFPGIFKSYWNFCHKDRSIRSTVLWCHIIVKPQKTEEKKIADFVIKKTANSYLKDMKFERPKEQRKEVASIAQVLTAVKEEHDKGNMVPRKLVVSSHTATPNNTPFDLTPPKSPDHHEKCLKDDQVVSSANPPTTSKNCHESDDDECSVVSLSSESDAEFVVIPMPKCFNFTESYSSKEFSRLASLLEADAMPLHAESGKCQSVPDDRETTPQKEQMKLDGLVTRSPCTSETVSQETGVPELSEHASSVHAVFEIQEADKKISISQIVPDGSSSEISIIESEDNSPVEENVVPAIESISIALSSDSNSNLKEELLRVSSGSSVSVNENIRDKTPDTDSSKKEDVVEEDQEAPCSATFPKFPIEGISSMYEPSPANLEERTIQVLPEGLVTGALSAAASLYNTARAVISTVQQPRNERDTCLSQELPNVPNNNSGVTGSTALNPSEWKEKNLQLIEMGFCNRQQNELLLQKHNGDVARVVEELVNLNDNDWHAYRHRSQFD